MTSSIAPQCRLSRRAGRAHFVLDGAPCTVRDFPGPKGGHHAAACPTPARCRRARRPRPRRRPSGAATPAERCRAARYKAAARHALCQQLAFSRSVDALLFGGTSESYKKAAARCRLRLATTWTRIQASISGTLHCSGARFVTSGVATIVDKLTGLEWEQKTDDGTIHDKDDIYSWSASGSVPDGTLFTTFLPALNGGGCYAGRCDWRLPTQMEIQTILAGAIPCATCVDPIFAPLPALPQWTGTEDADVDVVRDVWLATGDLNNVVKTGIEPVRAVRGGL
jgi:hypothetical protein